MKYLMLCFKKHFFAYDDDGTVDKKAKEKLLRWLCLFISLWQKKFNVTDSAVEYLLKFLMLFFKVLLQEKWCEGTKETFLDVFPSTVYSF